MIQRTLEVQLIQGLKSMPVVVILGPRQVGKTTLALDFAKPLLDKPIKLSGFGAGLRSR